MDFDRFDIVMAYYLFFIEYHEGQGSDKYRRLCKMLDYFTGGRFLENRDQLSENGQMIYDRLVERERATQQRIDDRAKHHAKQRENR